MAGLERDRGARALDGTRFDLDCSANVSERPARIHEPSAASLISYQLVISYDGTSYFGWQKTRSGPSIQETLEQACEQILGEKPTIEAASRTDRGVHAKGQVVQFYSPKSLPASKLNLALNSALPAEIRICSAQIAAPNFHPTLDAKSKEYHYDLCIGPVQEPFYRRFSWHYPFPLDLELMEKAAVRLTGTLDFTSFTTEPVDNPIRTLYAIRLIPLARNRLRIAMTGDRFLYKMARTIAGTIANIGSGKIPLSQLEQILSAPNRSLAGVTAPAHGLTLNSIQYKSFAENEKRN